MITCVSLKGKRQIHLRTSISMCTINNVDNNNNGNILILISIRTSSSCVRGFVLNCSI